MQTTVGYGDLLPETTVQKLYTMIFMPLAATTLAATVDRFEKLATAKRIHDTNFRLVADVVSSGFDLPSRLLSP